MVKERIKAIKELQEQILVLREDIKNYINSNGGAMRDQKDVIDLLKSIAPLDKENVFVLFLNAKNKVLSIKTIEGMLTQALVYPREIVKEALELGALSIILAHNHPSFEITPSENDKNITKKLFFACKTMDIELLDHIILGDVYFSFCEYGLIDNYKNAYNNFLYDIQQ